MKAFTPKMICFYFGGSEDQSLRATGAEKQKSFLEEQTCCFSDKLFFHFRIIYGRRCRCFQTINIHGIITAQMCCLHPSRLSSLLAAACVTNWFLPAASVHRVWAWTNRARVVFCLRTTDTMSRGKRARRHFDFFFVKWAELWKGSAEDVCDKIIQKAQTAHSSSVGSAHI